MPTVIASGQQGREEKEGKKYRPWWNTRRQPRSWRTAERRRGRTENRVGERHRRDHDRRCLAQDELLPANWRVSKARASPAAPRRHGVCGESAWHDDRDQQEVEKGRVSLRGASMPVIVCGPRRLRRSARGTRPRGNAGLADGETSASALTRPRVTSGAAALVSDTRAHRTPVLRSASPRRRGSG